MEKFEFKKQYGQNFLINNNILEKIVNLLENKNEDLVLEIGPGSGNLTKKLIEYNYNVLAFEIDTTLDKFLNKINSDKLKVVYKDFLTINLEDYLDRNKQFAVVANIPYYITTPIINKFLKSNYIPEVLILMVQQEVAIRLCATPSSKDYGAISVLLNYFFECNYEFTVNRKNFYPIPNVDSAVIMLKKRSEKKQINNYDFFEKLVYQSFSMKRKTIKNNLYNYDLEKIEKILKKNYLTLNSRAEEISYEVFIELANELFK